MMWGKLDIHVQKKLDNYLVLHTKINPNVRAKTIQLPEENMGTKFPDIGLGNDFFFLNDTKSTINNNKIEKWGCIKLNTSTQQREQSTEGSNNLWNGKNICKLYIS